MNIRLTTLRDMRDLAAGFQQAIDEDTRRLEAVNVVIAVVEADIEDKAQEITRPQESKTPQILRAIHLVLQLEGPMHRSDLLKRIEERGIALAKGRKGKPIDHLSSYLSLAPRAKGVGRGVWAYDDRTAAAEDETEGEDGDGDEDGSESETKTVSDVLAELQPGRSTRSLWREPGDYDDWDELRIEQGDELMRI